MQPLNQPNYFVKEMIMKSSFAAVMLTAALTAASPFAFADSGLRQGESPSYGQQLAGSDAAPTAQAATVGATSGQSVALDSVGPQRSAQASSVSSRASTVGAANAVTVPIGAAAAYPYSR